MAVAAATAEGSEPQKNELQNVGIEALSSIKNSEPPQWLAPPPELALATRTASKYLFSEILPSVPKCPLSALLTENFDAEQIWLQLDLQARPLLSSVRARVKTLEKNLESLIPSAPTENAQAGAKITVKEDDEGIPDDDDMGDEGEEEEEKFDEEMGEEQSDEDVAEKDEMDMDDGRGTADEMDDVSVDSEEAALEDKFFRVQELEKFLNDAEKMQEVPDEQHVDEDAEESEEDDDDVEEEEEEEEDDDEEEKEKKEGSSSEEEAEEVDGKSEKRKKRGKQTKEIMYDDFFVDREKSRKRKLSHDDFGGDDFSDSEEDEGLSNEGLSTHDKEKKKILKKIKELERENLESKSWTMQGEVTAAKRPKNSALEVQLEFDHNIKPAPVITEEVTASLEDIIKKRIVEARFDDVQRKPAMPTTAPKERVEIDENKSSKGLAEIYETEYMQRTGLAAAPASSSDALKKEATLVFKTLCVKLDALSHFHFTPKPIIEDMSIEANVPALAMEEVAPLAVSDAAMLAPEELFAGEGVIKAKEELSREDKKRLRAKKKHKNKALKPTNVKDTENEDKDERMSKQKKDRKQAQTHFAKSSKVFADLDQSKSMETPKPLQKNTDATKASFLKL